ncbi:hypothetical protein [Candidatus Entotheonella palauensis]|uniref:hypothetical protein n=1 Tax=Candidatus Entotheonella palauensis TaxID=93172 RepID=UPI000B7E4985|nr:hypothetical protein [Candidatus Entotheonella palauensis]
MDHLARIIAAYDTQGIHRTGTATDHASGEWLASEVAAIGFEPIIESFPFNRIDIEKAALHLNGHEWTGTPIYDGSFTATEGVHGSLGLLDSEADIAVAPVLPNVTGPLRQAYDAARRDGRYQAMIAITDDCHVTAGVTLINADAYTAPFGPPVLQLSSAYMPELQHAIRSGSNATLIAAVNRTRTEAFNVGTVVRGQDPSLAPLIVMTPRSGWWACASERGGGIAAWLAILAAMAEQPPRREVRFIATTGHELGHLGLAHHLAEHSGLLTQAHTWIHLGANFAARHGEVVYQAADQSLMDLGLKVLTDRQASWDRVTPVGTRPLGEAQNIYDGGGRYLSLLGSNPLFHHPDDRWPDAIDPEKTAPLVHACVDMATALAH